MSSMEITLQIFHRHFKIPLNHYLETVADFTDPWDERAYQHFVQERLKETRDQGIVGMVRQEKDDHYVYLDAAVRYPIKPMSSDLS